jgi:hypothetical protein
MTPVRVRALAIITAAVLLPACSGESGPSPLGRKAITAAFSSIEILVLERDVAIDHPASSVDAIYVPASNIVNPSYRLLLFDDQDAAERRARALEQDPGPRAEYVQHENAILVFRGAPDQKRNELVAVLMSL